MLLPYRRAKPETEITDPVAEYIKTNRRQVALRTAAALMLVSGAAADLCGYGGSVPVGGGPTTTKAAPKCELFTTKGDAVTYPAAYTIGSHAEVTLAVNAIRHRGHQTISGVVERPGSQYQLDVKMPAATGDLSNPTDVTGHNNILAEITFPNGPTLLANAACVVDKFPASGSYLELPTGKY